MYLICENLVEQRHKSCAICGRLESLLLKYSEPYLLIQHKNAKISNLDLI